LDLVPTYRDFLRPRGLGWAAGTGFALPTGDFIFVSVERDYARGPVEPTIVQQLNELRPHIPRSTLLSARPKLERARIASETLALIGLPALVYNNQGAVLAANQ
jgi:hypothetical protein